MRGEWLEAKPVLVAPEIRAALLFIPHLWKRIRNYFSCTEFRKSHIFSMLRVSPAGPAGSINLLQRGGGKPSAVFIGFS